MNIKHRIKTISAIAISLFIVLTLFKGQDSPRELSENVRSRIIRNQMVAKILKNDTQNIANSLIEKTVEYPAFTKTVEAKYDKTVEYKGKTIHLKVYDKDIVLTEEMLEEIYRVETKGPTQ